MSSAIGSMPPSARILTGLDSVAAPAAVSPGAGADPSRAALYQSFGASLFPAGPLGTRLPQNAEDSAIILAQAALAIDAAKRAVSDARIANATTAARSTIGQAIAEIVAVAAQQQATSNLRAVADTERTAAVVKEAGLEKTITDLDGKIVRTEGQIANAKTQIADTQAKIGAVEAKIGDAQSEDAKTSLRAELGTLQTELRGFEATQASKETELTGQKAERTTATAELSAVRSEITRLNGVIAELDAKLATLAVKAQEVGAALLMAYSQVAIQVQASRDGQRQDTVESLDLDRSLNDTTKILESVRANDLARLAETAQGDRLRNDEALRRATDTVIGLVAGLAELIDVLGQATGEPARDQTRDLTVEGRESVERSGQRLQLSL